MKDPYKTSPMLGASLIFLGAVMISYAAYFAFGVAPKKLEITTPILALAGTGYVLWVIGSILLARSRFSSARAGFLCGLFLLPGLIALLTCVHTRTRQEIWQLANRDFSPREQKRQYRNFKSLY
jgi:hypothetical protein